MNLQIKQLIDTVGTDVSGKWMAVDKVELIAELIVKECANELIKWKDEPFPYDPEFGARLIKQHFGVEV
jgi:hypothetical protein